MSFVKLLLGSIFSLLITSEIQSQKLPSQWTLDLNEHSLRAGGTTDEGLYDESRLQEIRLYFKQANYWTLLTQNYNSRTDLLASLQYDGETFDSIGVRFKGQTSYGMGGSSQKKSFNITMDFVREDQQLGGYKTLNLNNSFEDASFMREVFYYHNLRNHAPAAKANFVRLFINDQDWGVYQNVQQLNKDFLEEWWLSNDGSNFRADSPTSTFGGGPGGGGGAQWGDGTAALNYLGEDTTLYQKYYTLKSTDSAYAWDELIEACMVLNQADIEGLTTTLAPYFDLDKILWHLAGEVLFSDDDSYIFKGKMDYYLYKDAETGRITTYDYDGNSVMKNQNVNWSPFYNEAKVNYPLMNRLLKNTHLRQRYLAHLRVLIDQYFDETTSSALIDKYATLIDAAVQADPKKRTTYAQFNSELSVLKNFIKNRKTNLLNNAEVKLAGPEISNVVFATSAAWVNPLPMQTVTVTAHIQHASGVASAYLYYGLGLDGMYQSLAMKDDGSGGDQVAGDGIYTGIIPGYEAGTYIRFYLQAATANTAGTLSFYPKGAEHDVMVYQVASELSSVSEVVINEFMASNTSGPKDENNQFEDWIELYNKSNTSFDLSGFYLSDNPSNIKKWQIPQGTTIPSHGYLIFWCDEDQEEGTLHTNFKLSASGETLFLSDKNGAIVDSITYSNATENLSIARIPNGTGSFVQGNHTFNANNSPTAVEDEVDADAFLVSPNPANQGFRILYPSDNTITVMNTMGQVVYKQDHIHNDFISTLQWAAGLYFVRSGEQTIKLIVSKE